jgi:hypothetical protein
VPLTVVAVSLWLAVLSTVGGWLLGTLVGDHRGLIGYLLGTLTVVAGLCLAAQI